MTASNEDIRESVIARAVIRRIESQPRTYVASVDYSDFWDGGEVRAIPLAIHFAKLAVISDIKMKALLAERVLDICSGRKPGPDWIRQLAGVIAKQVTA